MSLNIPVNSSKVFKGPPDAPIPVRNVKNEKNTETRLFDQPRFWTVEKCAEKLMEDQKADEIDGLVWDLRGTVFFELKRMGKFLSSVEGPDVQDYVDKVMRELVERI